MKNTTCGHPDCPNPTRLYPSGYWCDDHCPAARAGRSIPVPDPTMTAAALRARR